MDSPDNLFEVECVERDGPVVRHVRFAPLSIEDLRLYWEKLSVFPTLFNRQINTFEDFITTFISEQADGNLKPNALVWRVDDIGLLWVTDIYPAFQATSHFTFWDKRIRGREPIIRKMLSYLFHEFGFHRIVAEVPLYSGPTNAFVRSVGFTLEGRMREAVMYKDSWFDVHIYSVLEGEIEKWDS